VTVHDTARLPALTPAHPLFYKALALHLQLALHDQTIQLADARARLALAERQAMNPGLEMVVGELRDSLQPPDDHPFNWQTLTFDPPAPSR
jgi:hypothetical protein